MLDLQTNSITGTDSATDLEFELGHRLGYRCGPGLGVGRDHRVGIYLTWGLETESDTETN